MQPSPPTAHRPPHTGITARSVRIQSQDPIVVAKQPAVIQHTVTVAAAQTSQSHRGQRSRMMRSMTRECGVTIQPGGAARVSRSPAAAVGYTAVRRFKADSVARPSVCLSVCVSICVCGVWLSSDRVQLQPGDCSQAPLAEDEHGTS